MGPNGVWMEAAYPPSSADYDERADQCHGHCYLHDEGARLRDGVQLRGPHWSGRRLAGRSVGRRRGGICFLAFETRRRSVTKEGTDAREGRGGANTVRVQFK